MRKEFDEELQDLNARMISLGTDADTALRMAAETVASQDPGKEEKVRELEDRIDGESRNIEDICMRLILKQQPVATDLRRITGDARIVVDLERIGDYALDIAELIEYSNLSEAMQGTGIQKMMQDVIRNVGDAVDAYARMNEELARDMILRDDTVDREFEQIKHELVKAIRSHQGDGESFLDLFTIARSLERIGDHANNIGEWVLFEITGNRILEKDLKKDLTEDKKQNDNGQQKKERHRG